MILDILQDAYIYECDSDTPILYTDLVNTPIASGTKSFRLNFDFNINISHVNVNLLTTSGVTASGYYGEIKDLGYPCTYYSFNTCLDQVNPNYLDLEFENYGVVSTSSGVVCSGMLCDGDSSYLKSSPYFLFSCSYTTLLYFKQSAYISGATQDNLFFRAEGPTNKSLNIGITQAGDLSLMLYDGVSESLYNTGLSTVSGTWNLLSLRCSPKTKLRIGCNNKFFEINKSCTFLGGSVITYLGGCPNIGYFDGVLSDFTWWPNYGDNIFIENAITYPEITLNGQRRPITTSVTSSGVTFDLDKNYPDRIYLEFNFPVPNMITGIGVFTHDDNFTLVNENGIDTLFAGTVVRGYTSTNYPVSLYNNTDYQSFAYIFPYACARYKALSISEDGKNYFSNQVSLPTNISWKNGEFKSAVNNEIVLDIPYRIDIESDGKIILYDDGRKCLWWLSKDTFGFYDLRTNNFYTRTYPSFMSGETGIYTTKCYWDFGAGNNCIYLIFYKYKVCKYNIINDTWSLISTIPPVCDNVCISVSSNYVFYVYYLSGISEVFKYTLSNGNIESVCSFNVSSLRITSNDDMLFVFNGSTIFKYDVETLNIVAVSQNVGLSNVLEIKDVCCYLSIITTSAVYSLDYFQDGWGVLSKVYSFSSSFSVSTVNSCIQSIAFVKSNDVYLTRLSHYRYREIDVNTHNNYNNTLSLLPVPTTERYKIVWAWLDTEEGMPDFYLASKFSIGESTIYGFFRDITPAEGTMSVFMSFNFVTKKSTVLASVVANNIIDVENGCLVEVYNKVYYINFNKGHYYKYTISTNTWSSISPPKTYDSVSNCTVISAVYDLGTRVYLAGVSLGGYISQAYDNLGDRYYSFFGYISINTDVIHSLYYLPYSDAVGCDHNGNPLGLGGTSFTCDLNYNSVYNYLFLAVSQYTSMALIYAFTMSTPIPSGSVDYLFDSLEDLYDYGCIIYSPFTGSISRSRPITGSVFNNLMNNYYFYTNYYIYLANSDIPERTCLHIGYESNKVFKWLGGSIGLKTDYNFSVNIRIKVSTSSSYHMPTLFDSVGTDGFEVGFDESDNVFACCRKGETYISSVCSMASAGVIKGQWVDLGASLSCASGTDINLYINGSNVAFSHIDTTCSGYNSSAVFHLLETVGSPYLNDTSTYYYNHGTPEITELTVFNKILSDTMFSGISYSNSGKPIARILMDYNVITNDGDRLPLSGYSTYGGSDNHWDGVSRVYSIYDYTSDYIYYLSDYTLIKFDVVTATTEVSNLRASYNVDCDYNFETATIKGCFFATNTNTAAGQSTYGVVYVGSDVFDDFTKYYNVGSFVSPIIDVGETGIVAYNLEYDLVRDSYLEFYVRYANDKPVDFCHIYYIDFNNTFIESSLATGKIFHTSNVTFPKSCDIYYDDTIIKITIDGYVYESTNYVTPINVFGLVGYTLANVAGTWFSYNGAYILYYTSDKYLVGFPLSIGIPCMRSSVTYSSVNYVSWSKYAQRISVVVDEGVYIYDYMLGEEEYVAGAYRVFYIYAGPVIIKSTDNSVLLNKDGVYYTYIVDDIDFNKNIEFDYVTEWMYYVTLDGNLKRMRYIQSEFGYELEFLDIGISNVTNIFKVTYNYIILIINSDFVIYNKVGFIAISNYPFPSISSGSVVFFDYNPTNKTEYYDLEYLSNNDLIWSDLLYWTPLGSKSSGFIIGKKYIQLKIVFKASSDKTATPILRRIYFGSPVRVGPILPHSAKDFFIKLDVPLDDQADVYSVKLITLAEDIVS